MNLANIINAPWAITPDILNQIHAIYAAHCKGDTIDIAAVEKKIGRQLNNSSKNFMTIQQGVAVIEIQGVIAQKVNLLNDISGGTSSQLVSAAFQQAIDDTNIKGIILYTDSPGGVVAGTGELSEIIYQARGKKPIVAFSDGMIASAAYWIASACDSIHISSDTNPVGSIGVVSGHRDYSGYEEKQGIKVTEISAGQYKRVASSHAPLTSEGRASIQEHVDYLYGTFVDTVARNRGVSSKRVLSDMADGRVFLGKQAVKAGLVDGLSTLPAIIASMQAPDKSNGLIGQRGAGAQAPAISNVVSTIPAIKAVATVDDTEARRLAVQTMAAGGSVQVNEHCQDSPRQFVKSWAERNGVEPNA